MDTEVELSMRKLKSTSAGWFWQQWDDGISSEEETSDVRVKDVDVMTLTVILLRVLQNKFQIVQKGSTARSDTFKVLATSWEICKMI